MGRDRLCRKQQHGTVNQSYISGSADLGKSSAFLLQLSSCHGTGEEKLAQDVQEQPSSRHGAGEEKLVQDVQEQPSSRHGAGEEKLAEDVQEQPSSRHGAGEEKLAQDVQEQPSSRHGTEEENWEQNGQEGAAGIAEESSSAKENLSAWGGHGGEEGLGYVYCVHPLRAC